MPRESLSRRPSRRAIAGVGVALIAGFHDAPGPRAVAEEATPPRVAAVVSDRALSATSPPQPFPRRGAAAAGRRGEGRAEGNGSWWLGPAGVALALAVCGGVSLAARRGLGQGRASGPGAGATRVRVIGRTSLSPRHTVHLLSVGGRVLIVGTGPQGAPSLLGELDEDDGDLPRPDPRSSGDGDEDVPGPAMPGRVVSIRRRPAGEDR